MLDATAAALVAYLAPAGASAAAGCGADSPFVVSSFTSTGSQCLAFPGLASLPRGPFAIADSFPMPYFVTAPCHDVSPQQTNCTSFNGGDRVDTPAFAVSNTQCFALGHNANMSLSLLSPGDPTGGVAVAFGGGVGGRKVTFHFVCDESAAASAGPTQAIEGGMQGYVFLWPTAHVCKPQPVAAARCPAQAAIPKPSTELLLYQEMEMGALICYNMGESTAACEYLLSLRFLPPIGAVSPSHHLQDPGLRGQASAPRQRFQRRHPGGRRHRPVVQGDRLLRRQM